MEKYKQVNFNTGPNDTAYDAIVIGSGISGGWAAKELCQSGLKTLLLERGRDVKHIKDYSTANLNPWDFKFRLQNTQKDREESPIQSAFFDEGSKQFFVKDIDHPYVQDSPFHWIRGYQVGGRSLIWGRQCYRLSDLDFEANKLEGVGVDWPIRYNDVGKWYDYVESFVGVSGQNEGLNQLPDGIFQPPMEMNCVELHFKDQMKSKYNRCITIGRTANLTQGWKGRGPCQFRNLCKRGCPFGGYFSSNSATLPIAFETGNLTLRPHSIVSEILYDKENKQATGVRIVDAETLESYEFYARIIFLNASTIGSAAILLNSTSDAFPNGLGNTSDQIGRNLMDHHGRVGAVGNFDGFPDKYYSGRRPNNIYIPRFRNVDEKSRRDDYLRGFGYQGLAEREFWQDKIDHLTGFGEAFKDELLKPGFWKMHISGFGETLPNQSNRVMLAPRERDKWGFPLVHINLQYGANEFSMRKDMKTSAEEMLDASGFTNISGFDFTLVGGDCIHEMGTARMGTDPKTSVVNKWNQMHDVSNVFITDGSCMTSSACQNPSLTYMALTARACDYAVSQLKAGTLK